MAVGTTATRRTLTALAIAVTTLVTAAATEPGRREVVELTGDHVGQQALAGRRVRVHDARLADAFVAGGEVELDEVAADNVFVAGGALRLRGLGVEDLITAGGDIRVHGSVRDDLIAAGGRIHLDRDGTIGGDVVMAGGDLELAGHVDGNVTVAAGRVVLSGTVGGDVDAAAGRIVVDAGARIAGKLVDRSGDGARISPRAEIAGGVQREPVSTPRVSRWGVAGVGVAVAIILALGAIVMAVAVHAVIPGPVHAALLALQARPGTSWLLGFALLVAVPVAANLLLVTIVGVPLALLVYVLYAAGLALGVVTVAYRVGRMASRSARVAGERAPTGPAVARTALGTLLLAVLAVIPLLGWLALLAAIPAGVGAFATVCWRAVQAPPPAATAGDAPLTT